MGSFVSARHEKSSKHCCAMIIEVETEVFKSCE